MAKAAEKKAVATERMYEILRYPVVTEKSTLGGQHGQVTFRVPLDATKAEIKGAVEVLFNVEVMGVNTLVQKGKTKRFKGRMGKRSDAKKAMVSLKEGQMIDIGAGV